MYGFPFPARQWEPYKRYGLLIPALLWDPCNKYEFPIPALYWKSYKGAVPRGKVSSLVEPFDRLDTFKKGSVT
jgi:hypothetical protein